MRFFHFGNATLKRRINSLTTGERERFFFHTSMQFVSIGGDKGRNFSVFTSRPVIAPSITNAEPTLFSTNEKMLKIKLNVPMIDKSVASFSINLLNKS